MNDYERFLDGKAQSGTALGFEPLFVPDYLYGFQRYLLEWSVRKGKAATLADCGLGKTPMQLVWSENVVRHTNRPVLLLTPISVGKQTLCESMKFGVDAVRSVDGSVPASAKVVITNYEKLHKFSPHDFSGVVCDESSILKNFDGVTRDSVVEFMRTIPYRSLYTATAAPNDYVELGNSAEALGEMGFQDMITKFFRKETAKDYLGWGRTVYKMRGHAERDFWRWVCSWSRAVRTPSDLGFSDERFVLPPLHIKEHVIKSRSAASGMLFDLPARDLHEQREVRRRTLPERCEKVGELVANTGKPAVVWCHLNDEGAALRRAIPDAVEVSGADSDEAKEEAFSDFVAGKIRVIITKPTLAGFGLNWQHCAHQTFFPSHSFEQYYQSVRRCWRFGQTRPVTVDIVTEDGGSGVLASLQRKSDAASQMFSRMVELMNDQLKLKRTNPFTQKASAPSWTATIK